LGTTYTVHVFIGVRETLVMRARRDSVNMVTVRECPGKHRIEPSWKVCPICASPVTERQKRSVKTMSPWEAYEEGDAMIADMCSGNNIFVGLSIFSRTPRDESGDGIPRPSPTEAQWQKATAIVTKYDTEAKPSLLLVFYAG